MTAVAVEARPIAPAPRWLYIVSGVLWLIVSLVLLSFDTTGAAAIGFVVAFVLVFAGVEEIAMVFVAPSWKWLHGAVGVIFLLGGISALFEPLQTFGILALLVGWYLVIKGAFDMARAIAFRGILPLWGLGLAVGILEIALGIWAIGYPGRSAWLLLLWAGVGALFRSIGDFVTAFTQGGVLMRTHPRSTRRRAAVAGLLVVLALLMAPACAKKYQAERDGKDIGQSLCDVRDADTPEEARAALQDFNQQVDDLSADVSTFTAEDRADIEEQVSDLVQHVGDDLLVQQDLTVHPPEPGEHQGRPRRQRPGGRRRVLRGPRRLRRLSTVPSRPGRRDSDGPGQHP